MKAIILTSLLTLVTSAAMASNCKELKKELAAMQQAQTQIMNSLVSNHETFASTLEEYSSTVDSARGSEQSRLISSDMNASAKAFRARGLQGKRTAMKLHQATGDLLERISACLK
ncbi:MAG: hypothetical protein ACM3MG_01320 [Bacillota bacterium]